MELEVAPRLTVLSCFLKQLQIVPCKYNSICVKIFRSICIAAGLNKFTTVATGYTDT